MIAWNKFVETYRDHFELLATNKNIKNGINSWIDVLGTDSSDAYVNSCMICKYDEKINQGRKEQALWYFVTNQDAIQALHEWKMLCNGNAIEERIT